MGAWSTRIFDEDGASDIRAEYKILLGYGVEPEEAYQKIYEAFYKDYEGSDDEDVFWLGIALFQWQNGILREDVKEKALECIDNEEYLERWKDSGEKVYAKRKEVLYTLRDKLLHEVNPTKKKFPKCPKYYREKTKWKVGDLLAYQVVREPKEYTGDNQDEKKIQEKINEFSQKYFLLRVVHVWKRPVTELYPGLDYCSGAKMMLYDWYGDEIPPIEVAEQLQFKPIVVQHLYGKCEIASGVNLDEESDGNAFGRIVYLGNDDTYITQKPEPYMEEDGCPRKKFSSFNRTLADSFLRSDNEEMIWHYRKGEAPERMRVQNFK